MRNSNHILNDFKQSSPVHHTRKHIWNYPQVVKNMLTLLWDYIYYKSRAGIMGTTWEISENVLIGMMN